MSPVLAGDPTAAAMGDVTNRGRTFNVEVDAFNVEHLIEIVEAQLTGAKLTVFLRESVYPQLRDEIFHRFADEGDRKVGQWEPLTDTTQDIRTALGYRPNDINIRSGQMFLFLQEGHELVTGPDFAELQVPGDTSDDLLVRKINTAQEGSDDNPLGFGPTPPRPVLAAPDDQDIAEILEKLQAHIMVSVAGALL